MPLLSHRVGAMPCPTTDDPSTKLPSTEKLLFL